MTDQITTLCVSIPEVCLRSSGRNIKRNSVEELEVVRQQVMDYTDYVTNITKSILSYEEWQNTELDDTSFQDIVMM